MKDIEHTTLSAPPSRETTAVGDNGKGQSGQGSHFDRRHGEADVATLVRAAAEEENAAREKLVERYVGLVWFVARSCGLNTAEATTVSQTTWLRLVQHLGTLRHPERLGHWLAATARHECLRIVRQTGHLSSAGGSDRHAGGRRLEAYEKPRLGLGLGSTERSVQLWEAFVELQPRCQQLLRALLANPSPSGSSDGIDRPTGAIGLAQAGCLKSFRQKLVAATREP